MKWNWPDTTWYLHIAKIGNLRLSACRLKIPSFPRLALSYGLHEEMEY